MTEGAVEQGHRDHAAVGRLSDAAGLPVLAGTDGLAQRLEMGGVDRGIEGYDIRIVGLLEAQGDGVDADDLVDFL